MSRNKNGDVYRLRDAMHGKSIAVQIPPLKELRIGAEFFRNPGPNAGGVLLESYRGWDAHFWDKKWIQDLRAYCTEHRILFCFDEIQSGFGRTGKFFAYEHYEVQPDLVCIGKAMGGGLPVSGLLGSKVLLDLPGDLSSTHSGWPLGCAAGLAVLEEFERLDLVKGAKRKGETLQHRLYEIVASYMWCYASGEGMVAAILTETGEQAKNIVNACYARGLLVVHTSKWKWDDTLQKNVLVHLPSVKIGPPLTIPDEQLEKGLDILEGVLCGSG
jgi:4-aminobutyrate aminotransferase-like enzyme